MNIFNIFKRKPKKPLTLIDIIRLMAERHGWNFVQHQESQKKLRFDRITDHTVIDVWYSRMTVCTILNHPTQQRTALYRKRLSMDMIEDVFKNPRIHTNVGYQKKRSTLNRVSS